MVGLRLVGRVPRLPLMRDVPLVPSERALHIANALKLDADLVRKVARARQTLARERVLVLRLQLGDGHDDTYRIE